MANCECGKPYDLEKHHLVPASRIVEETAKRQKVETELQARQTELAAAQSALSLSSTRLQFASGAPDEGKARQLVGAYEAAVKGMEKPPSLEAWAADPAGGAWIAAALRPAAAPAPAGAAAPAPAGAPTPAPAPAGAAPAPSPAAPNIPNTNTGALPASPGTRPTPAQVQAAQASLLTERRAAVSRGDTKAAEELRVKIQGLYATAGAATT